MSDAAPILFAICSADVTAQGFLQAADIFKLFPAGVVEQELGIPYATYATVGGRPSNTMDSPSRADNERIQIDAWSDSRDTSKAISQALRNALENEATQSANSVGVRVVGFNPEQRDPKTKRYCVSFDVSFWTTQ